MRALLKDKRLIGLLAMLALAALSVLAISLNDIPFRQGQRFRQSGSGAEPAVAVAELAQVWAEVPVWKQVTVWFLIGIMVALVGMLLSPEMRKQLLQRFVRIVATFWGLLFIVRNYGDRLPILNLEPISINQSARGQTDPLPVFDPPQVSPEFSYLISFALALLWLILMWALYRGWKNYARSNNRKPMEEIARIARASLDDLSAGRNSSDVIINCYLRMSSVVSNKRHLQRDQAMTPHEFALRLEQAGLPGDAVRRLTRLFEAVRYGDRTSGPRDINEAVGCLNTILHYCGEPV